MTAKEKIVEYLENKGISKNKFYIKTGLSQGYLNSGKTIGLDKAKIIVNKYPDINLEWLVLGTGPMTLNTRISIEKRRGAKPLYSIEATAGDNDNFESEEKIEGYIDIPGVQCMAYIHVRGCSMEPKVEDNDIIGIDNVDNWETLDPDRIYYIVTDDNRMIKHLKYDAENEDELICISSNFKNFPLQIESIKKVYKVVFVGRLV